jgi:NDP-sugar pyrophosphorylase family protein
VNNLGDYYAPLVGDSYAPDKIRAIFPIGGKAKRLLPLTAETSKACLRLLNRPMVEFSLLSLASQGMRNFIFGVKGYHNYRDLYDYFESGYGFSAKYNVKPRIHIKYQPNVEDIGSADSIRINMEYFDLKNHPLFVAGGDDIFDISIKSLLDFHKEKGAALTIVLREVENVEGLGIADISADSRINRFVEKPLPQDAPSNLANTGLYVLSPEIRKLFKEKGIQQIIKEKNRLDFGYDLIPYILHSGRQVYGYKLKTNWFDVGTPNSYLEAMRNLLHGGFSQLTDFGGRLYEGSTIWVQGESNDSEKRREEIIQKIKQKKITLEGAVLIGRHCQIDDGARLVNSCIDNFTRIGKNAVITNSAIMDRAIIGEHAEIHDSIIGRHVAINSSCHKPTKITAVSVIADDVTLEEGCSLTATKVYPHQHIRGEFQNQTIMAN